MYRLLIVDDEPLIVNGIKRLIDFVTLNITEVYEASNGVDALLIVEQIKPHIVLADINMPHMDGLTLAQEIKKRSRHTKVAIITGYDYFEYALTALKTGVDDYVLKPVSKKDIVGLLQKLVGMLGDEEKARLSLQSQYKLDQMLETEKSDEIAYKEIILRAIHENLTNPEFSLATLAQSVNLSQGYLSTLFKSIFAIPFQDYIVSVRLERAKILLLSTPLKIYEISEKVGFDDPNYFSTSFKKHFNLSPNQFRQVKGSML
jgi:two-component system, response regulator YesN